MRFLVIISLLATNLLFSCDASDQAPGEELQEHSDVNQLNPDTAFRDNTATEKDSAVSMPGN